MSLARCIHRAMILAALALLPAATARGQEPPKKPDTSLLNKYRNEVIRGGIPEGELPQARAAFAAYAKYNADLIAYPGFWKPSQDIKADPNARTLESILHEIDRFLLAPGDPKSMNFEPASYVREMGAALDAAFRKLIESHPERVVRINATRALAHVARTGAPAHFKTVIELLGNPKTPTEIKYYLFHAAGALLHANDAVDLKLRKHAGDPRVVGTLVKILQDCIGNPAMLLPGYKPELATDEQLQVIALVRRQAVRALGQVKFVMLPGPDDKTPVLYPSFTLVRVAMGDPALVPTPGPAECAEAVIGLCHMAPVQRQGDNNVVLVKNYNADIAVVAMAQGLVTFAEPRARVADRTLPWRSYALRIGEAMYTHKPLYDPFFDFLQPKKFDAKLIPASFNELYNFVVPKVLAPMERVDNKGNPIDAPEVPGLRGLLERLKGNLKGKTQLFEGVKETSIDFAPPKK